MGFESINQPGRSSEIEHNPKMSISCCWLERGGRWGSSPLTSPADHQKLNVIQKWTFYFLMTYGAFFNFLHFSWCFLLRMLGWSSEVERSPKMNIWFFDDLGGLFHFFAFWSMFFARIAWLIIRSWTKNEHFIFWWLRGPFSFFCILVDVFCLDCLADHQKLNIIQKWTFYFSMT